MTEEARTDVSERFTFADAVPEGGISGIRKPLKFQV